MFYALHITVLSRFYCFNSKQPQAENEDERNEIIAVAIV